MKKFYAFVCAVVVALTASAGPIDFAPKAKKDITKLELSTKSFKTNLTNAKRVKRASRISANDAALEADKQYLEQSYSFGPNEDQTAAKGWQTDGSVILRRAEDGTYTIENFFSQGINLTGGVYDAAESTLTFEPQVVASGFTDLGAEFESVMAVIVDNYDEFIEDHPIVFDVDIPNRNLFYMCDTDEEGNATNCLGLACMDKDNEKVGFLDWLAMIDLNQVNGMSAFGYYNSNNERVQEKTLVYNEVVEGNLVTTGLFGYFGYPVTFTLNQETNTAVADNQVVVTMGDGSGASYDFMFYDLIFNEDSTKASVGEPVETFEIIPQEGAEGIITYIYKDLTVVCTPYNGQMSPLVDGGFIYGFQILYVGDIFDPTGIHDVQLDKNTNAPVEYYNLQGIRVNEPTKGGIYIRRQGNVSTKIMR